MSIVKKFFFSISKQPSLLPASPPFALLSSILPVDNVIKPFFLRHQNKLERLFLA